MADEQFNPSDHTVDEVNAYLADADETERTRVLDAEAADKDRSTVKAPEPAQGGLSTGSGDTFQEAAEKATTNAGEAYKQGYFGYVPSRDGDNPEDLTLQAQTKDA